MKISIREKDYLIQLRDWEYRIYITQNDTWQAERRRETWVNWEKFNQNEIPAPVAREAIQYWNWVKQTKQSGRISCPTLDK